MNLSLRTYVVYGVKYWSLLEWSCMDITQSDMSILSRLHWLCFYIETLASYIHCNVYSRVEVTVEINSVCHGVLAYNNMLTVCQSSRVFSKAKQNIPQVYLVKWWWVLIVLYIVELVRVINIKLTRKTIRA